MIFRSIVLTALSFFITSCGLSPLGDRSVYDHPLELDSYKESCLKTLPKDLSDFFTSTISKKRVLSLFSCMDSSVNDFMAVAKEESVKEGFNRSELFQLLKSFIYGQDTDLSMAKRFLAFKRALVAGDESHLERSKIEELKNQWNRLKEIVVETAPHMKYLALGPIPDGVKFSIVSEELDRIEEIFNSFIFKNKNSSLSKNELLFLAEDIFGMESLSQFYPISKIFTEIYFKHFDHKEKNWSTFLEIIFKALKVNAYFRFSSGNNNIIGSESQIFFWSAWAELFNLVEILNQGDLQSFVTDKEIFSVFKALSDSKVLFHHFRDLNNARTTLGLIAERFFQDKNWVLDQLNLNKLKNFVRQATVRYIYSLKIYGETSKYKFGVRKFDIQPGEFKRARSELRSIRKNFKPNFKSKDRLGLRSYTYKNSSCYVWTPEDLLEDASIKNVYFTVIQLLWEAMKQENITQLNHDKTMDKDEFGIVYHIFKHTSVDLGFMSPYALTGERTTFMESDLFTQPGNGDRRVSSAEFMGWMLKGSSSGMIAQTIYDILDSQKSVEILKLEHLKLDSDDCAERDTIFSAGTQNIKATLEGDLFYKRKFLDRAKVIDFFKSNFDLVFGHFPHMVNELSAPEKLEYVDLVVKQSQICTGDAFKKTPLVYYNLVYIMGLTSYIEQIFSIYDRAPYSFWGVRDEPGVLEDEFSSGANFAKYKRLLRNHSQSKFGVWRLYQERFKPMLEELSKEILDPNDPKRGLYLEIAYIHLLKNKSLPNVSRSDGVDPNASKIRKMIVFAKNLFKKVSLGYLRYDGYDEGMTRIDVLKVLGSEFLNTSEAKEAETRNLKSFCHSLKNSYKDYQTTGYFELKDKLDFQE